MTSLDTPFALTPDLVRRHDVQGPRYTSYPTADRFSDAFDPVELHAALARREAKPLSVYVHVPFCESICYYCGCNKVVTRDHGRASPYLDALEQEMALYAQALGPRARVSQLHLGGGTPTFLSDAELSRLMAALRRHFDIAPGAEQSIEVDPRTVTRERLQHVRQLGFDRLSFGVQDFDPDVQQAVHRIQPHASVEALMKASRAIGFASVNVDMIYGLPRQTPPSFATTVRQVIDLRPDRIALYAYAHLPHRFKPQRRIVDAELPDAQARVAMLAQAVDAFQAAGHVYIGMDHFALPGDGLAVAKAQGRLHRNFQGYTTQPDGDLIGLGVSAIGEVGGVYAQNAKTVTEYVDAVAQGRLPVVRGWRSGEDDRRRRAAILSVMCRGELDFADFARTHGASAFDVLLRALPRLQDLAAQGLIDLDDGRLQVTPLGWYFVRAVAMVFDAYLPMQAVTDRYSRVI